MKCKSFFFFIVFFLVTGTVSITAQNKTNSSKQIKNLIAKKRTFNKKYGYGFRIQIFYGDETKARKTQAKFKVNFPGVFSKLDYDQPYWKVIVGNYKTKLEADKAAITFSEKFSGLIVIPLGK